MQAQLMAPPVVPSNIQVPSSSNSTSDGRSGATGTQMTQTQFSSYLGLQRPDGTPWTEDQGYKQVGFLTLRDVFILDTGSSIGATVMNPDFVTNIWPSQKTLLLATNAGNKPIATQADIPDLGTAWYDESLIANILGFASLKDKYKVSYSDTDDAFYVQLTPTKQIKFERNHLNLYVYEPPKAYLKAIEEMKKEGTPGAVFKGSMFIQTVEENRKGYTARQQKDAYVARKLYRVMGFPTVENFKRIIRQHIIKNCPVTVKDIEIAEDIYGPSVSAMKGKKSYKTKASKSQGWWNQDPKGAHRSTSQSWVVYW